MAETPREGVSSGSGGRANRVTSDKREGNLFPLVSCVFR